MWLIIAENGCLHFSKHSMESEELRTEKNVMNDPQIADGTIYLSDGGSYSLIQNVRNMESLSIDYQLETNSTQIKVFNKGLGAIRCDLYRVGENTNTQIMLCEIEPGTSGVFTNLSVTIHYVLHIEPLFDGELHVEITD